MAKLVFGLNQSLDGYVDHRVMPPEPGLFRHLVEHVRGLSAAYSISPNPGALHGRKARSHPCATPRRMEKSEIGTNRQLLDIFPFFSDGGTVARSMPESRKAPWVKS
jgi:hypothetical protein